MVTKIRRPKSSSSAVLITAKSATRKQILIMKTLYRLEIERRNKLIEMTSKHDQCAKQGFEYVADDRDLARIDELDAAILDKNKHLGI